MDYATLKVIWWVLIGVLLIGFALTDGFDMGAAILLPFIAKTDAERRIADLVVAGRRNKEVAGELYLALDGNAEIVESLLEQALSLRLWQHQRVGIGALHAAHVDAADDFVTCDEINGLGFKPGIDERGRSAAPVQQFQGSAPQNKGLGLVGPLCCLVDDADSLTVARKLRGHCHSDWTGADD